MNNLERWWFFPLFFFKFTAISYTVILHELHVKAFGSFMWIGNESRIIELFYEDNFTMSCQQQRCFHKFAHKHTHRFCSTKGTQKKTAIKAEKQSHSNARMQLMQIQNIGSSLPMEDTISTITDFFSSSVLMFNTLGYIVQNIPKWFNSDALIFIV